MHFSKQATSNPLTEARGGWPRGPGGVDERTKTIRRIVRIVISRFIIPTLAHRIGDNLPALQPALSKTKTTSQPNLDNNKSMKWLGRIWIPTTLAYVVAWWTMPHYSKVLAKMYWLDLGNPLDINNAHLVTGSRYNLNYDSHGKIVADSSSYYLSFFLAIVTILLIVQTVANILLSRKLSQHIKRHELIDAK